VREEDVHKTAFQTHGGLIEWVAIPFGLCNAPTACFQRMMIENMRDVLHKFVTVYFDDVFVYYRTWDEHPEHLRIVLQRFKEEAPGWKLCSKRCFVGLQEMEYLGYNVSASKLKLKLYYNKYRQIGPIDF
jgi:hypothetical protein